MAAATNNGLMNGKEYALKIGSSFQPNKARESYHLMRYDFKPASIDTSRSAEVEIGSKNVCTVKLPNGQDSGITTYKGGKKPAQKDCILIIDKETGEITLEKISSMISLKKSRVERTNENNAAKIAQIKSSHLNKTSKSQPLSSSASHSTKTSTTFSSTHRSSPSPSVSHNSNATIPSKTINTSPTKPAVSTPAPAPVPPPKKREKSTVSTSDSYSSSSDSSDSDSGGEDKKQETEALSKKSYEPPSSVNKSTAKTPSTSSGGNNFMSTLQTDLHLSDSNESDSD